MNFSASNLSESERALETLIWDVFQTFFRLQGIGRNLGMVSDEGLGAWNLMRSIAAAGGEAHVSQLAAERALPQESVKKMVEQLIEQGAVATAKNLNNPREAFLSLTPQGEKQLSILSGKIERLIKLLGQNLDTKALQQSSQTLQDIQQRLARLSTS
ncbi:MarR family winged helix-turn-helix transcriptional regulator [Candidatus Venteria ishoeyi]|uniref:MarR family protein n=1 Tax=Candidatus Venteria ishoeyi TaxID=1899563 RepID=A0A1H6F5M7_9GAMM|nr:MarR family winged helix-turn-helix transcriptional regulator [Candidatus Venteria ishoeyi]MDM8545206.1 MarR family winged helix-turn-helix transcriptional regulator [Candidatus Venteria ishoeyi]SEH04691.1 Uncharacterised protein [Candidatus Venteria ishoeyi]